MPEFDAAGFVAKMDGMGLKLTAVPLADGRYRLNRWRTMQAFAHGQQINDLWASQIGTDLGRIDQLTAHLAQVAAAKPKPAPLTSLTATKPKLDAPLVPPTAAKSKLTDAPLAPPSAAKPRLADAPLTPFTAAKPRPADVRFVPTAAAKSETAGIASSLFAAAKSKAAEAHLAPLAAAKPRPTIFSLGKR
jgi:hypothetical protein